MKKRVLSAFMALALCLTLLPAPAWAEEADAPEGGAPAVSEQAGTNEDENGAEGGPQNTGTPDAGSTEESKADAPEGGEDGSAPDDTDGGDPDSSGEAQDGEADAAAEAGTHTAHCVCGKDSTTVNGHTHSTNTAWKAANSLPNSAGSYYLTQSVSGGWTVPEGEVNLCLNGQTIDGSIKVGSGASLTLTDCSSDNSGRVQGEVTVNGGKFELYDGTITGGVQVGINGGSYQTGSSFTMYGGAITGNEESSGSGGGVFLVGTTNHIDPPNFTMHGGTISNNTAGASNGGGGGVYVGEKCSFTMDGGTITGNTATAGNGGGIYIHYNAGSVSISNATITGNKASATGNTSYGHGGGIYSERGVTVENVKITGNNSAFEGGGIYGKGAITLTDATVTDNNRYDVYYGGKGSSAPELTVSGSVKAGYYANFDWKLPILVSGELSEDSVIRVGVYDGIKPAYGSQLAIAEPANGVMLSAENFKADAADSVTSLGDDGKVYLSPCNHEMDDTGYTCKKCRTQFGARVGDSAYYQTLTEAFNAVGDSTVTLLRDVTLKGNCSATDSKTLDLNGKTVSSERYYIGVGGGNNPGTLTVMNSGTNSGTQPLTVKFLVYSNGTLAVDNSYTGEISRVELQAGGALERFGGKIGELVLINAAAGSTSTGYGLKLWKGNTNACTIGGFTDNTKSKSLTVKDLLGTDYAKCELYGEKDGAWSIVPKTEKISELTGYTAYKVQFPECVHQCDDDTVAEPVCSVCHKNLYTKITAKAADGTTKTAYFTADSALENGYVEAIQTLNGWSNEGCTEPTLTLLRDMPYGTSITLTGTLTLEGGTHTARNVTVAENANVTFASGSYKGATINGTATVETGVTFTDASVTVNGTLNAKGGTFDGRVEFNGSSTANISGGSFNSEKKYGGVTFDYNVTGTISGGTFVFADFYTTKVKLSGGTFTIIKTNGDRKLADLLAEGAAYYGASDNQAVTNDGVNTLENVKVVSHTHDGGKDSNGTCSICGKQMAASLTVGDKTSWYTAFASAIEAANAADGEKTITLYQDVNGYADGHSTTYELTHGPVTLATGGKSVTRANLTAKGISLTVTGSNGGFNVSVAGKDAELTVNDGNTKLAIVTAQNGGKLSLSNGTFSRVAVKDDSSSASLSGGSYGEITSDEGYVKPYALLAKGYAYKKEDNTWVSNANIGLSKVTVEKAPYVVKKIYPNSDEGYTGNSAFATDGSITLTAVIAPETEGVTYYYWWELFDESKKDWTTTFSNVNSATHTGGQNKTLSISGLPENSIYQYRVDVRSNNGYQCYSEPFTVTRHQHSWTYTASGATITATCSQCSASGGSVTINKPAHTTYGDGQSEKATLTENSWQGLVVNEDTITYTKDGTSLKAAPTDAGTYTASITLGGVTASVGYTIKKAIPTAGDFIFRAPASSDLTYNGNPKTATVTFSKSGMGEVTVKYYQDDKLVEKPTNAGDYTVKISVADGTNYEAVVDNLTDPDWKFTITRVAPTPPTGLTGVTGKKLSTVTLPQGWSWSKGDTVLGAEGSYTFDASYAGDNNHNSITTNLTVTVSNKSVDKNTLSLTQPSMTYGQGELPAYELTHKPATVGENRVHYTGTLRDNSSYDSDAKPTQAGSYTVAVMCETADTIYTASANFTIYPIDLGDGSHGVGFSSPEITYTGNAETASVHPLGPNGSPQMTTGTDYKISGTVSATNVGEYTATIQGIGNNYTGEVSGTWQIIPAPLTISGATVTAKIYDGSTSAQVTGVTFTGLQNNEELELDTDYEVTAAAFNDANVNADNKVTGTVALKDTEKAKNYTLSSATFEQAATIGQADFTGTISKTIPIVKNRTAPQTGTLTAADFFLANQLPDGAKITGVTQGSGTLMSTVDLTDGKFSYVSKTNIADAANEAYTVTIATTNYTDITATLTFHLTDKESVTISGLTYTDKTYDGHPIAPTGALVVSGNKVPVSELEVLYTGTGTTVYQSADAPKNAGTYQVTYSVAERNESFFGSAPYSFTIAPKPVTVAPKSLSITKGDALPAFELVCNGLVQGETLMPSVQPAFTCFESDGTTAVTANTAAGTYAITWTNADGTTFSDANYTVTKETAGTLTITARASSGGGGGSSVTTYPVNTPSKTQSGSVTSTLKNASKGDTVTITVKPDSGYVLDGLTVTDRNGNVLKLTDQGGGKYTFIMPASKVEVNAAFVPETVSSPFADVSSDSYYAQPVQWAADQGITGGIGNGLFGPNQPCTRAQIVTFLWRAAGSPEPKAMSSFADVSTDAYYAKAVAWAVENGITTGTGDGKFSPDTTCTRAQSVTFLFRAIGKLVDSKAEFSDVLTDSYYANAVAWAVENGVTNGIGDGLFGPDNSCTRAQIVTFLFRAYQGK